MRDKLETFLSESDIPERVRLPAEVIIHRTELTPADLLAVRKNGKYVPVPERGSEVCELEIGGQVLASGKIIKKGKYWYFKVKDMNQKGGAS